MRKTLLLIGLAVSATAAHAGNQSSNTSSNSSSNNGVVRERVVDTYCEDGFCQRYVQRRVYRDARHSYRDGRRRWQDWRRFPDRRWRDRDDDD